MKYDTKAKIFNIQKKIDFTTFRINKFIAWQPKEKEFIKLKNHSIAILKERLFFLEKGCYGCGD